MPERATPGDSSSLRALVAPSSIAVLGASERPSGALSLIRSLQRLNFGLVRRICGRRGVPAAYQVHDTRRFR